MKNEMSPFLDALASDAPTPGGGAVAGVCGALAAALAQMVSNLTVGKKKYAEVEGLFTDALPAMRDSMTGFLDLAERDAEAFDAFMAAFRLPKESDEDKTARKAAIRTATIAAAEAPLETLARCKDLLPHIRLTADKGNKNLVSDAGIAALLVTCAARAAAMNVKINLSSLKGDDHDSLAGRMNDLLPGIVAEAEEIAAAVDAGL